MTEVEQPEELAARVRTGDRAAEERLVKTYGSGVRLMLARHARNREDAEDLYQETFRVAIEKLRSGELREASKLPAFLVSVARNLAIEFYRKAGRRRTDSDEPSIQETPSQATSQLDQLLQLERAALARGLIDELGSGRDREILFRFYIAEEDKDRIASDLGLSPLQFNRVLHRARQRYKQLYKQRISRLGGGLASSPMKAILICLVPAVWAWWTTPF